MPETIISAIVARSSGCPVTARRPSAAAASTGSWAIGRPRGSRTRQAASAASTVSPAWATIASGAPAAVTMAAASAGPMTNAVS